MTGTQLVRSPDLGEQQDTDSRAGPELGAHPTPGKPPLLRLAVR